MSFTVHGARLSLQMPPPRLAFHRRRTAGLCSGVRKRGHKFITPLCSNPALIGGAPKERSYRESSGRGSGETWMTLYFSHHQFSRGLLKVSFTDSVSLCRRLHECTWTWNMEELHPPDQSEAQTRPGAERSTPGPSALTELHLLAETCNCRLGLQAADGDVLLSFSGMLTLFFFSSTF